MWMVNGLSKQNKIMTKQKKKMKNLKFLRVNLIDDYNIGMGGVDIADQLRLQYRIGRWMRQRKWWWAIFLWSIGVANKNAYVCYSILNDERVKNKLPTSHKKICTASSLRSLLESCCGQRIHRMIIL